MGPPLMTNTTSTTPTVNDESKQGGSSSSSRYDYIFGYGSIINTETHGPWLKNLNKDDNHNNNGLLPGRAARIRPTFGYTRGWNFRSSTGFTALGLHKHSNNNTRASSSSSSSVNGVLFRIPHSALVDFDRREVGYDRVQVALEDLEFLDSTPSSESDAAAGGQQQQQQQQQRKENSNTHQTTDSSRQQTIESSASSELLEQPFQVLSGEKVWIYVPQKALEADEDHPILQSYVDTVLQGCLEWGGEAMAREFVETTDTWSPFFLNDTPSSRRPWLFRKEYDTIDNILRQFAPKTFYAERRHPEEFASAFLIRMMRGTWSLPKRNAVFTGRDAEIDRMHQKLLNTTTKESPPSSSSLSSHEDLRTGVSILEVVGMGGVGKTQICTEYCYRYFPSCYGLVIWLSAQSAESISTGYRQLIADTTGADVKDKDADEVVTEVKARLFRSNVPWLLVFDNLEDRSLLEKFVPHGGSCGHVLVTTRLSGGDVDLTGGGRGVDQTTTSAAVMTLGCFSPSESVELLRRSAGDQNVRNDQRHIAASQQLAEKLGNLPLALGMAAAYMRRCDVDCIEYLTRYEAAERGGGVGDSLGVQAVEASLSLSLNAISKENPDALDTLCLLSWLAPDQITKPLMRSLFRARKQFFTELALEAEKTKRSPATKYSILGGCVVAVGSLFLLARSFRDPLNRQVTRSVALLLAAATAAVVAQPFSPGRSSSTSTSSPKDPPGKQSTFTRSSSFTSDEYQLTDQTWTILKSFSLLSVKGGKGSMHRLLGQALRASQDEATKCQNLEVCVRVIQQMWKFKPELVDTWQESADMLEHLKSVVSYASKDPCAQMLETSTLARQAGLFSAMALNRFKEAQFSLEQSLEILDGAVSSSKKLVQARAASLQELGRVYRYQGDFASSETTLQKALDIRHQLAAKGDISARREVAATLHELGVLESKKHNLDAAAAFLQESLGIRRSLEGDLELPDAEAECASTLHQLAAVHVARKPPSLDMAEALLQEALGLQMQIGQRAATLKQLARVAIRRGEFDQADRSLAQALELYVELYGETLHINVAAVKFQQGALAFQRENLDEAWLHFSEALQARRHVYAYTNGHHLEVSAVLHELGCVAFAQGRIAKAEEMLTDEKEILDQLYETSSQRHRIIQARLTNLTWLRKCAKELGKDEVAKGLTVERTSLKLALKSQASEKANPDNDDSDTRSLQREALLCRLLARQFALTKRKSVDGKASIRELTVALENLERLLVRSPPDCSLKTAAHRFHQIVARSIAGAPNCQAILGACDDLRDVLRENGVEVNDSVRGKIGKR